ncbi:hypothetical protein HAX54_006732, partial [Datura stramonium]|nr:hypothetical protein [Datura stramonium]
MVGFGSGGYLVLLYLTENSRRWWGSSGCCCLSRRSSGSVRVRGWCGDGVSPVAFDRQWWFHQRGEE